MLSCPLPVDVPRFLQSPVADDPTRVAWAFVIFADCTLRVLGVCRRTFQRLRHMSGHVERRERNNRTNGYSLERRHRYAAKFLETASDLSKKFAASAHETAYVAAQLSSTYAIMIHSTATNLQL